MKDTARHCSSRQNLVNAAALIRVRIDFQVGRHLVLTSGVYCAIPIEVPRLSVGDYSTTIEVQLEQLLVAAVEARASAQKIVDLAVAAQLRAGKLECNPLC